MVSPQKGNGYVGIANEIWDEIIRRDFTKRQKDILFLIFRLSYGCNQKAAVIPLRQDFALCGLGGKGHVSEELKHLEKCKVIAHNKELNEYSFNKNYELWQIAPVRGWDDERFKELVHINLLESKKRKQEVPETRTITDDSKHEESPQNRNDIKKVESPKQGHNIPETGTTNEKTSLKQGQSIPETGTTNANESNQGAASDSPKKGLKKEVIKPIIIKTVYLENISLSDDEYSKLIVKFESEENVKWAIEKLSNYKFSKVTKYKSDYHVLIGWVFDDFEKRKLSGGQRDAEFKGYAQSGKIQGGIRKREAWEDLVVGSPPT